MDLDEIKEFVKSNSVFEFIDTSSGIVHVPTGDFHDIMFTPSAVFEEGDGPDDYSITTTAEALEKHACKIRGKNESDLASAYLFGFYSWLLANLPVSQTPIAEQSIKSSEDLEVLFDGLPDKCTNEVCLLTTKVDFSKMLAVPYGSSSLSIAFKAGDKMHNRDLLAWGEPLLLIPGPRKRKVITVQKISIVLNAPQTIDALGNDWYSTELQFKIIQPQYVHVYSI